MRLSIQLKPVPPTPVWQRRLQVQLLSPGATIRLCAIHKAEKDHSGRDAG